MYNYNVIYHFVNGNTIEFAVSNSTMDFTTFLSSVISRDFTTHLSSSNKATIVNNRNILYMEVKME